MKTFALLLVVLFWMLVSSNHLSAQNLNIGPLRSSENSMDAKWTDFYLEDMYDFLVSTVESTLREPYNIPYIMDVSNGCPISIYTAAQSVQDGLAEYGISAKLDDFQQSGEAGLQIEVNCKGRYFSVRTSFVMFYNDEQGNFTGSIALNHGLEGGNIVPYANRQTILQEVELSAKLMVGGIIKKASDRMNGEE